MKKFLKWIGITLGALLVLLLIAGLYINFSPQKKYDVSVTDFEVQMDSTSIAEGKKVATYLCSHCHMGNDGKLSGDFMEKGQFGSVYSPNITQDKQYGIGNYSNGELKYLLRTGITKDGFYTPPFMIKLPFMSDEDIEDIIAFLRSDDPLVQPSNHQPDDTKYSFLAKALMKVGAFGPLPFPENQIQTPSSIDALAFGEYLAVAKYDCFGCHSANFQTVNLMEPEKSEGFFGGGNPIPPPGENVPPVLSANLTMDNETGIGEWTEAEFVRALRFGITPDGKSIRPPMMHYNQLTDQEASAIFTYLKTVPVIKNENLNTRFE